MILLGIGIGAQESIMRAEVANRVQMNKRGTAYAILNIWFGIFWFLGECFNGIFIRRFFGVFNYFFSGNSTNRNPLFGSCKK